MTIMKYCALIPTYNNVATAADVVRKTLEYLPVIVVVDGATDGTLESLEQIKDERLTIVHYEKNRGKGYALKTGFRKAREMGYTHVVTLDSDGQHYTEDLPKMIRASKIRPEALIVGSRELRQENMPGKNTFANKFSNFWYCIQTGTYLPDTQTGFRVYPLDRLHGERLMTNRYEAELLLLVFTTWANVSLVSVPIRVYYPPKEERVSYFRPARDFGRISVLNTILCVLAVIYGLPRRWFNTVFFSILFAFLCLYLNLALLALTLFEGRKPSFPKKLRRVLGSATGWFMRVFAFSDYKVKLAKGATPIDFSKPAIYIANHSSVLDVLSLLSMHENLVLVGKRWVANNILFGTLARAMGIIRMEEGMDNFVPDVRRRVEEGYSVAIFPEGTRSLTGELGRFHKGAFFLAEELNLPIRPLLMRGHIDALQKSPYIIGSPSEITVTILPEILPDDTTYGVGYRERTKNIRKYYYNLRETDDLAE